MLETEEIPVADNFGKIEIEDRAGGGSEHIEQQLGPAQAAIVVDSRCGQSGGGHEVHNPAGHGRAVHRCQRDATSGAGAGDDARFIHDDTDRQRAGDDPVTAQRACQFFLGSNAILECQQYSLLPQKGTDFGDRWPDVVRPYRKDNQIE